MIRQFFNKCHGFTLVELSIVVSIFFLFLIAFYITLEVGLKTWKMGEVASDLQSTSAIVIKRMANDIQNTNSVTVEVNDSGDPIPYLCVDTPIYNGEIQHDPATQALLWQGHLLYYALYDPDDYDFDTKILYRRYVPHNHVDPYKSTDRYVATFLYDVPSYVDDRELTVDEVNEGQTLKRVCNRLSVVKFDEDSGVVDIELKFQQSLRESRDTRVIFAPSGDKNIGVDKLIVKYTIQPRN